MSRGRHRRPVSRTALTCFVILGTSAASLGSARPAGCADEAGRDFYRIQNAPITFTVTGDVPYGDAEVPEFQLQLDKHNLYSPSAFLVHVGDIMSGSDACEEFRYQRMADQLRTLAVPAFIVPGDNETSDCTNPAQGWSFWEAHLLGIEADFCGVPAVERQSGREENFAFVQSGVLFMGIHLVGGSNSSSVLQDDAAWTKLQLQQNGGAVRAAVLFAQEGPDAGTSFWNQFVPDAAAFGKPVLVAHGDGHSWILDNPFGQSNMTRVQIERGDGPPLHVTVTMDSQNPFVFERDPWSGASTVNTPVCVYAGPDVSVSGPGTIPLRGIVTDDGLVKASPTSSWSVVNAPGSVTFGDPSSPTSSVTLGAAGTYVLRLSANDGQYSDSDDVSIFVGEQSNQPPIAMDEAYQTYEDVALSVGPPGVLQNDSDPDGDTLRASVSASPAHGSLSLNANGSLLFTPSANYYGSDSFTYFVSDGRGGVDTGHVSITILPVNDAPLSVADSYTTAYTKLLSVGAPGVLGNDRDVEGDAFMAEVTTPPAHGLLQFASDGSFSYLPDRDFVGWDSFRYVATDASASSEPTGVCIAVGVSTFAALDDATVRANQFKKNFGSLSTLEVRGSSKPYRSYLKFDVQGTQLVRAAKLRLYVNNSAGGAGEVHVVSNEYEASSVAWNEHGITWENAPALEMQAPMATITSALDDGWVEFDVTDTIRNGVVSFGIQNSSSNTRTFSSKEGAHPPELAIASMPPLREQRRLPHEYTPDEPGPVDKSLAAIQTSSLRSVYPNPTHSGAWIEYQLANNESVHMRIFNARGQRVRTLRAGTGSLGARRVLWDGRDDAGRALGSGVYFLQLDLGAQRFIRKILVER